MENSGRKERNMDQGIKRRIEIERNYEAKTKTRRRLPRRTPRKRKNLRVRNQTLTKNLFLLLHPKQILGRNLQLHNPHHQNRKIIMTKMSLLQIVTNLKQKLRERRS